MILVFDAVCESCGLRWEEEGPYTDPACPCPECGSGFTKKILSKVNTPLTKDPYDYLDGRIPDSKPIKSFAHDRRKGGKDTT